MVWGSLFWTGFGIGMQGFGFIHTYTVVFSGLGFLSYALSYAGPTLDTDLCTSRFDGDNDSHTPDLQGVGGSDFCSL